MLAFSLVCVANRPS